MMYSTCNSFQSRGNTSLALAGKLNI